MKFFKAVAVLGFGVAAAQDDACHSSHKARCVVTHVASRPASEASCEAKADCDADTKCTWCEVVLAAVSLYGFVSQIVGPATPFTGLCFYAQQASAVPSACYTKENAWHPVLFLNEDGASGAVKAAKLPPAVFTCATRGRRHRSELLPRAEAGKPTFNSVTCTGLFRLCGVFFSGGEAGG